METDGKRTDDFKGSEHQTQFIRTLDGRKAIEHRYDDMSPEEVFRSIDDRTNVVVPNIDWPRNADSVEGTLPGAGDEYYDDPEHP